MYLVYLFIARVAYHLSYLEFRYTSVRAFIEETDRENENDNREHFRNHWTKWAHNK